MQVQSQTLHLYSVLEYIHPLNLFVQSSLILSGNLKYFPLYMSIEFCMCQLCSKQGTVLKYCVYIFSSQKCISQLTFCTFSKPTTNLSAEKPCQFVNLSMKQTLNAFEFISIFTCLQSKPPLLLTQIGLSLQPVALDALLSHHGLYSIKQLY